MDYLDVGRLVENEDVALGLEAGFLIKILDVLLGLDFDRVLGEIGPDSVHDPVQKLAADALTADFFAGGDPAEGDGLAVIFQEDSRVGDDFAFIISLEQVEGPLVHVVQFLVEPFLLHHKDGVAQAHDIIEFIGEFIEFLDLPHILTSLFK